MADGGTVDLGDFRDPSAEAPPDGQDDTSGDRIDVLDMRPAQPGLSRSQAPERRDRMRLRQASWAFTTRRVPKGAGSTVLPLTGSPRVGDLILARVDVIGHHANLQLVNGRPRHMFPGDEIVVAYGNRYASNQFESYVPDTLGPCHLVAGGGIASRADSWHVRIRKGPTHITPIGLVGDSEGNRINVADYALEPVTLTDDYEPTTIAVLGTAMDSGKTQTCVHLVRGLIGAGLRVGYAKVTGTGAGGDLWWLKDAGASPVLDFTDVGMPSTYLQSLEAIEDALMSLITHVAARGVDAVVVEIADGVLQKETSALLKSDVFIRSVGGIVLAAQDAMGASAGVSYISDCGTPVLALAGVLTASPLQADEASAATGLPLYDREGLATPENAIKLIGLAQQHLESMKQLDTSGIDHVDIA